MQALVLREIHKPLLLENRPALTPGEDEVVIDLKAAALNRRDYWITQGKYPKITLPAVLGSDGAGVVRQLGPGAEQPWLGQQVVINPGRGWGGNPNAQSDSFRILGMPDEGTLATEVVVPVGQLRYKPAHLNWQQAAALPLAGLTAYRAVLTQGRLQSHEKVLITGIGGGVATFALQFALAVGAQAFVSSSSPEKLQRALNLGALAGANYQTENWHQSLKSDYGPMDLIIDGAGGKDYHHLVDLAAPGGRIVNYGATAGTPERLDLFKVFWKQLRLIGSTLGSPVDFLAMLDFVEEHSLKPIIDSVHPLEEGNAALQRLQQATQFGKIVIDPQSESETITTDS